MMIYQNQKDAIPGKKRSASGRRVVFGAAMGANIVQHGINMGPLSNKSTRAPARPQASPSSKHAKNYENGSCRTLGSLPPRPGENPETSTFSDDTEFLPGPDWNVPRMARHGAQRSQSTRTTIFTRTSKNATRISTTLSSKSLHRCRRTGRKHCAATFRKRFAGVGIAWSWRSPILTRRPGSPLASTATAAPCSTTVVVW